jgi:hypothetical protein
MTNNVSVPATSEAFRLMLKAMPVGLECDTPNLLGKVKRLRQNDWHLSDNRIKERSRFGDLEQMTEDMTFFHENGHLPPADMPRW